MLKNDIKFYSDYLNTRDICGEKILFAKTKNSYLIGPKIDFEFDEESFFRRLTSNSIYSMKIYKKTSTYKALKIINEYYNALSDNEVIECYKNGEIIKHKILKIPGDY